MIRPVTLLQSIALSAALLIGGLTSGALAVTTNTVTWTGKSNFNDDDILFKAFQANQLKDIDGSGLYEACCATGKTTFTLELKIDGNWQTVLTWKTKGDEDTKLLDNLVGKPISFSNTPVSVSGIRLSSSPDGNPWNDYNFTNFLGIMNRNEFFEKNSSKYGSRKEFDECDDYEEYVRKATKFVFACTNCSDSAPPISTPLPAALPLMGSVLGGFGFAMWRRRRKKVA